jgi:uncharacterized protein YrrD
MRLTKGADVYAATGEKLGSVDRVIINPNTKEVTHFVISKGFLFTTNKIIGIDMIDPDDQERISLLSSGADLDKFQDFTDSHYVTLDQADRPIEDVTGDVPAATWNPPVEYAWWHSGPGMAYPPMPLFVRKAEQNIPEGTVALEEGAKVTSKDGHHVGNVAEVYVDKEDNRATHILVSSGTLVKEQKLLPVTWISEIDEDEVHLSVDEDFLKRVPYHEPER